MVTSSTTTKELTPDSADYLMRSTSRMHCLLSSILECPWDFKCNSSDPICNRKFHEKSPKSLKSRAFYGGGHGTRRGQNRTNVENSRRKSAVHVCTRYCTQTSLNPLLIIYILCLKSYCFPRIPPHH